MKKKIFATALVLICFSILGYSSLAYFTTEDTARNVITTDGLDITIEEWQETSAGRVPYPKDEPILVMPATEVSKIVTVRNHKAESYIRAKLDVKVLDADKNEVTLTEAQREKIIILHLNETDWTEKDGWWYYGSAVGTEKVTKPLLTKVEFDGPNMTNEYQNCTVEIIVTAQAVQTAHNGASALDALGWPEEQ